MKHSMAAPFWSIIFISLTAATAKYIVPNPEAACSSIASIYSNPNVTINFSQYLSAGTNITLDQSTPELQSCTRPSQVIPADLCRVAMYVSTSNQSGITLEAWLPTNWTGRFLTTGNGGLSGCIQYEDIAYGNELGFATVGAYVTDTPHWASSSSIH
jgi:feruloyl esterase